MVNPERDEVALTIGDRTYTYILDMAALFKAEKAMSDEEGRIVGSAEILFGSASGSNRHTRVLLWAALQRHQPDVTLDDALTLLATVGGSPGLQQVLASLRKSTQPDAEDNTARPRKARQPKRGTGVRSTGLREASASAVTASGG